MLAFNSGTEFFEYFNYKINQFLEVEFYSLIPAEEKLSDSEVESLAEPFFAGHPLLNENPRKCFQIATDLYKWSGDSGMHYLDDLHSLALYNFLEYMRGLVEDDDARALFFDNNKEEASLIDGIWKKLNKKDYDSINNKREFAKYLQDINTIIGACFDDIDFVTFPQIINNSFAQNQDIPIDLVEEYRELLARDLVEYYDKIHNNTNNTKTSPDLNSELLGLLDYMEHNLFYRYLPKMLWANGEPMREDNLHHPFRLILDSYFLKSGVTIDHNVELGNGIIDFRLTSPKQEKIAIEVKRGSNRKLKDGLSEQLVQYMNADHCSQGYYLVFCFSEAEIRRAKKILGQTSNDMEHEIIVKIFDATLKTPPSKR